MRHPLKDVLHANPVISWVLLTQGSILELHKSMVLWGKHPLWFSELGLVNNVAIGIIHWPDLFCVGSSAQNTRFKRWSLRRLITSRVFPIYSSFLALWSCSRWKLCAHILSVSCLLRLLSANYYTGWHLWLLEAFIVSVGIGEIVVGSILGPSSNFDRGLRFCLLLLEALHRRSLWDLWKENLLPRCLISEQWSCLLIWFPFSERYRRRFFRRRSLYFGLELSTFLN